MNVPLEPNKSPEYLAVYQQVDFDRLLTALATIERLGDPASISYKQRYTQTNGVEVDIYIYVSTVNNFTEVKVHYWHTRPVEPQVWQAFNDAMAQILTAKAQFKPSQKRKIRK